MTSTEKLALPINVCVGEFPKLSETFVLKQITDLVDHRQDVRVLTLRGTPDVYRFLDSGLVERYELMQRTLSLDVPASFGGRASLLMKSLARAANAHWSLSTARVLKSALRGSFGLAAALQAAGRIETLRSPHIWHCHFGPNGALYEALRRNSFISGPVITTFHGADISARLARHPHCYDQLFLHGDLFLPISRLWADRLRSLGCPSSKIVVLHMGINVEEYRVERRSRTADTKIIMLTVSRLSEKKGIEFALRAFKKVLDRMTHKVDLEYQIIGDGPDRDRLQALSHELGLDRNVRFLGSKGSSDIKRHLRDGDIFLLPSVTAADGDMEGIPVAIMEAMASGLPVVSTLHSGIPELVVAGKTGLLAPEREVDILAGHIALLVGDPEMRGKLGAAGVSRVAAEFDSTKLSEQLLQHMRDVVRTWKAKTQSLEATQG